MLVVECIFVMLITVSSLTAPPRTADTRTVGIPTPGGKSVKVETKWRKSEQILNPPIKDQKRHW